MFSQMGVNLVPQAIALPESEVVIDSAPRSEVLGQIPPLAASPDQIEDCVEQLPERMLAASALLAGLGETIIDELPFGVGKIRCVSHRKRIAGYSTMYKLTLTQPLAHSPTAIQGQRVPDKEAQIRFSPSC